MPGKEILGPEIPRGRFAFDTPVQDLTPENFRQTFPEPKLTDEQIEMLREARVAKTPGGKYPLMTLVETVTKEIPEPYRDQWIHRAMSVIIPPDTEIKINICPPESTNGNH